MILSTIGVTPVPATGYGSLGLATVLLFAMVAYLVSRMRPQ
jgi:hypothetical protein